jgi:hypothetical protein
MWPAITKIYGSGPLEQKEDFIMKEKLAKLVNVKSIVTLIICGVFAYLSVIGQIMPDQFLTIFTVIISFYFGSQYGKKEGNNNG